LQHEHHGGNSIKNDEIAAYVEHRMEHYSPLPYTKSMVGGNIEHVSPYRKIIRENNVFRLHSILKMLFSAPYNTA
jgi:hypothetical protein